MKNINIVQKLLLDISVDGDEDTFSIPADWQAYFHEILYPAMEKVFSKFDNERLIRIDSLTLDIGDCTREEFADLFLGQLTEQLNAHLHAVDSSVAGEGFHLHIAAPEKPEEDKPHRQAPVEPEAFFFFMETGLVPWYFPSASGINPNRLAEDFLKMPDPEHWRNDLQELLKAPFVLQRLLLAFSPATAFRLLQWLLPGKEEAGLSLIRILLSMPEGGQPGTGVFQLLERLTVSLLFPSSLAMAASLAPAINAISQASQGAEGERRSRKAILQALKTVDAGTGNSAAQTIIRWAEMLNPVFASSDSIKIRSSLQKKDDATILPAETDRAEQEDYSSGHLAEVLAAEGINIDNAGLVLLHPFLPRFFKVLRLVSEEGDFISEAARIRAVQILHFLITGSSKTPEPSLILNKIFCGMDALAPVPARLRLNAAIRKECKDLLTAFTENWLTISASTTEGLLGSFIRRPGILKHGQNGWLVQVEHKAYDVLLDRLPWGIGLIRFRWNDFAIETEWNF